MNSLGNLIGEICKVVLPIKEEFYIGNVNSQIAICTLSSVSLIDDLKDHGALSNVAIIGRLFSENKGIDSIIQYIYQNKNIKKIILCGKEVWGHKSGHSLLQLHKNGVDENFRIINSTSPEPYLTVSKDAIEYFQKNITIIDLINETNLEKISKNI
ncbi:MULTISPECIES: tetrahydromethanopterin S-methyltransferase subunit A [Nitrosopumilus]|uniref:Tetrahydromethanopterin S-methyltransferase 23 kD subunit n=1 Tax=Nitrosopumilus piranensis TaxID=1582439 RepID=A0A0C5C860_9ARCH|nr:MULTISPECIES: tetrahydromethanopterin S-methyltransferase subunit A [Nitrosopumilus]AJM91417.1 Tetrahydromethanopterin S-methyltransferase 23 kD subunit [Nitrosopumilus piranensis]KAF6245899.1 tetrahydromethanopterin S-methyltransferase subunit A [Nitrosopumilus sp. b2]